MQQIKISDIVSVIEADIKAQNDIIPGGMAAGIPSSEFDPEALAKGVAEETEEHGDPAYATEVAKDHLTKDKAYYDKED